MQARPLARRLFSAVPRLPERTVAALERHCKVSRNRSVLLAHGKDESHHEAVPPEAVCFAASTVAHALCHQNDDVNGGALLIGPAPPMMPNRF